MNTNQFIDTALDRTVVLGFSRLGLAARRRLSSWPSDPVPGSMTGKHAAVTGATSGLGEATALGLARLGAHVHLVVRNEDKGDRVRSAMLEQLPDAQLSVHRCDIADLDDVRRFTGEFVARVPRLDVLVHNAGALPGEWTGSPQGHELTMAVHVLGPVLMTERLRPVLAGNDARVILVTSGGMYAQRLRADDPEYRIGEYSGTTAYARSKRAQVELLPILGERWRGDGPRLYATHPGWAATPGVAESLPGFNRLTGPVLRDAAGGADTTVWLSAASPPPPSGGLWHDRAARPTHLRARTRSGPEAARRMWQWVVEQTDLEEGAQP